jgi:FG-GAP-like repeat
MNPERPNPAGAVDAPIAFLFHVGCHWRRATDQRRSAKLRHMKTTISAVLAVGGLLWASAVSAAPAIQFGPVTHYTNTVGGVDGVCTGDFNGDGHLDLVTTDNVGITVWTNDGAGGFAVRTNYAALEGPRIVVVGDLNSDHQPDLLTANYSGYGALSAFLGQGGGTFSRVDTIMHVNDGMPGLALGDFNGDGRLDAALATYGIGILLGEGDGRFTSFTNCPGGVAYAVAVADFNGDGKLDLVTANYSYSSMSVYFGNGDGTFAPPVNYGGDSSEYHYAVAVGDFNHDGKPDLATVNYYNNSVSVRLNDGSGTYGPETKYKVTFGPRALAVGDFDHDGNLDIVAGQASGANALAILRGDGTGLFSAALTNFPGVGGSYQSLAASDFDGDGLVDLVTTSSVYPALTVRLNQSAALLKAALLPARIRLSWPSWPGYLLERRANLVDANSWITVTDTPAVVGTQKVLTNATTGESQFYRLRKP